MCPLPTGRGVKRDSGNPRQHRIPAPLEGRVAGRHIGARLLAAIHIPREEIEGDRLFVAAQAFELAGLVLHEGAVDLDRFERIFRAN